MAGFARREMFRVPSHPSWAIQAPLRMPSGFLATVLLLLSSSLLHPGLRTPTMVSSSKDAELCQHPKPCRAPRFPFPWGFVEGEKKGKILLCQQLGFNPGKVSRRECRGCGMALNSQG